MEFIPSLFSSSVNDLTYLKKPGMKSHSLYSLNLVVNEFLNYFQRN